VFPVERRLGRDRVAPGAAVAVRGFALTFIDAALALSEGRGGSFEHAGRPHRLRYVPGGDEPRAIIPFTRTGQPMLAKPGPAIAARYPALEGIAEQGRARLARIEAPFGLRDVLPIITDAARASLRAVGGDEEATDRAPAEAIEQSLAIGAGLAAPDRSWSLGHTWRSLYPAIVARLGGDGLAARDWPAFLRLEAEMERVAFGPPPLNAAKLLALVEAGLIDLAHLRRGRPVSAGGQTAIRSENGERAIDVVVDAVLPAPGAAGYGGLLGCVVAHGFARIPPARRGLDVAADGSCRALDGSIGHGLSVVGRPSEDSVIGNDTLSRTLHPQADLWAQRVARRAGCGAAEHDAREREPAPA
jgi:diaminopimelate decarboxylase